MAKNYAFDIKDISDGGCALIAPSPNLKFLANNSTLKKTPFCLWLNMAKSPLI